MRTVLISPLFTERLEECHSRKKNLDKWVVDNFYKICDERKFDSDYHVGAPDDKNTQQALQRALEEGSLENASYLKKELCPKGKWIRQMLQKVIDWQAENYYVKRNVIIHIDGSGKIDFNSTLKVLDKLVGGDPLVLGYRKNPLDTMLKERVDIEKFENFLVGYKFKILLPDAQCGCWGINGDLLSKITLTSLAYSIELDLVISALSVGIEPRYISVDLNPETVSSSDFKKEEHINKLHFLMYRLGYTSDTVKELAKLFLDEKRGEISREYLDLIEDLKPANLPLFRHPIIY